MKVNLQRANARSGRRLRRWARGGSDASPGETSLWRCLGAAPQALSVVASHEALPMLARTHASEQFVDTLAESFRFRKQANDKIALFRQAEEMTRVDIHAIGQE